eukprot:g620.t1
MSAAAYVPDSIVPFLASSFPAPETLPATQELSSCVVMFLDVSGFTALTESMSLRKEGGLELLAKYLNSYFEQLVRMVAHAGGDVLKFAGDALMVLWQPVGSESLETRAVRTVSCGLEIQDHMHEAHIGEVADDVVLSVKVGIGCGQVAIIHVGGVNDGSVNRMEYVTTGAPLIQAFGAEHHATAGEVVCSPEVKALVEGSFTLEDVSDGFARVDRTGRKRHVRHRGVRRRARPGLGGGYGAANGQDSRGGGGGGDPIDCYVPLSLAPFLNDEEERWGSELRRVSIMFVNVGFSESELNHVLDAEGAMRLHNVFSALQRVIFDSGGTINKFLVDDKGSTLIAVFGLPPLAHKDDATRAALCSLAVCGKLHELGLPQCAVGVTSGTAFCGVVGHRGGRREYTVLGDVVNLAARLMQHGGQPGSPAVVLDAATHRTVHRHVDLEALEPIMVKGKANPIQIYCPRAVRRAAMGEPKAAAGDAEAGGGSGEAGDADGAGDGDGERGRGGHDRASSVRDVFALEWRRHVQQYGRQHTAAMTNRPVSMARRASGGKAAPGGGGTGGGGGASAGAGGTSGSSTTTTSSGTAGGAADPVIVLQHSFDRHQYESRASSGPMRGSLIVIEGDVGSGKTRLLSRFLGGVAAPDCWRLVGAGNVFEHGAVAMGDQTAELSFPLELLRQAIEEASRVGISFDTVDDLLAGWCAASGTDPDALRRHSPILNRVLSVTVDEEAAQQAEDMKQARRAQQRGGRGSVGGAGGDASDVERGQDCLRLVAGLLAGAVLTARERGDSVVLSVDDARELSETGWRLLTGLTRPLTAGSVPGGQPAPGSTLPIFVVLTMQSRQVQSRAEWRCGASTPKHGGAGGEGNGSGDRSGEGESSSSLGSSGKEAAMQECLASHPWSGGTEDEEDEEEEQQKKQKDTGEAADGIGESNLIRQTVALRPLTAPEVGRLACDALGVVVMPPSLQQVLYGKSEGNPLFVLELIGQLIADEDIVVNPATQAVSAPNAVRREWAEDKDSPQCSRCSAKFTSMRRRHHCRCCGKVFCGSCASSQYFKVAVGYAAPVRHCVDCFLSTGSQAQAGGGGADNPFARLVVKIPATVQCVLAETLDSLTTPEQMVLKVGAMLLVTKNAAVFKRTQVLSICPISAHGPVWEKSLRSLVAKAVLTVEDTFILRQTGAEEKTIRFAHGYMAEVVRQRMLSSHQVLLQQEISEFLEKEEAERRRAFLLAIQSAAPAGPGGGGGAGGGGAGGAGAGGGGAPLKSGFLSVKKHNPTIRRRRLSLVMGASASKSAGDAILWKTRWAILYSHKVDFFHEPGESHPTESVMLKDARIEAHSNSSSHDSSETKETIAVRAHKWQKREKLMTEPRTFWLAAPPDATEAEAARDTKDWLYLLKYAVEGLQPSAQDARAAAAAAGAAATAGMAGMAAAAVGPAAAGGARPCHLRIGQWSGRARRGGRNWRVPAAADERSMTDFPADILGRLRLVRDISNTPSGGSRLANRKASDEGRALLDATF